MNNEEEGQIRKNCKYKISFNFYLSFFSTLKNPVALSCRLQALIEVKLPLWSLVKS